MFCVGRRRRAVLDTVEYRHRHPAYNQHCRIDPHGTGISTNNAHTEHHLARRWCFLEPSLLTDSEIQNPKAFYYGWLGKLLLAILFVKALPFKRQAKTWRLPEFYTEPPVHLTDLDVNNVIVYQRLAWPPDRREPERQYPLYPGVLYLGDQPIVALQ